ncbi:MAG: ATP-binding protein [Desulfuromonadales bacterium]
MKNVKKQIVTLWLGGILLLTTLMVLFIIYSRMRNIEEAGLNSKNLVAALQEHIRLDIAVSDRIMQATTSEYLLLKNQNHQSEADIRTHFRKFSALLDTHIEFMHIADADGNVVQGIDPQDSLNIAHRDYFIEAKNSPDSHLLVSKPLKGMLNNAWNIYFTRRMNNENGSFAGVVSVAYHLQTIRNIFSRVNTGPGGSIVLRSSDMGFLTRFPDFPGSEVDIGKPGNTPPQLLAALESGAGNGTLKLFSPTDNTWRISSFARITPYPFIIIIGQSLEEILKLWYFEVYCLCGALLVVIFLSWFAVRKIQRNAILWDQHLLGLHDKEMADQLNVRLEIQVKEALAELRRKDQMLISQSRHAAMGDMISSIAHHWRQPLNALSLLIGNLTHTYQNRTLTDEYFNKAAVTAGSLIQEISQTISEIRDLTSPDIIKESFSAAKMTMRTAKLIEAAYKNDNISISVEGSDEITMYGFPNEFSKILMHLLDNARDAIVASGVAEGHITITCGVGNGMAVTIVRDNGGGIPIDTLDRIFDPYFTTKGTGSGIDLYISKSLIERNMQGRIEVHNIEGGCEFAILIPLGECPS